MDLLLKNKALVNLRANDGNLPIHIATEFGHKAIVRMLLKHKSEVNAKTNGGWTPVFMASQEGYLGILIILLLL